MRACTPSWLRWRWLSPSSISRLHWLASGLARRLVGGSTEKLSQQLRRFQRRHRGRAGAEQSGGRHHAHAERGAARPARRADPVTESEEENDTLKIVPISRGMGEIPDIQANWRAIARSTTSFCNGAPRCSSMTWTFGPAYTAVAPLERRFFQQMRMSAYARRWCPGPPGRNPGCGAKASDDPFTGTTWKC